jgi:tripartite-type tricarboxylate transporter receptor subunit TctC
MFRNLQNYFPPLRRWSAGIFVARFTAESIAGWTFFGGIVTKIAGYVRVSTKPSYTGVYGNGIRVSRERVQYIALCVISIFADAGLVCADAAPAGYPRKPIRMIIPAAPGGAPDVTGRLIAGEIGKQLGQQVVVENRPGSGGVIGFEATARATPDGYTIGLATFPIATNPSLFAKLPYDALRDLQMVVQTGSGVNLLVVNSVVQVKSVQELVDLAQKSPGNLSFGSSGNGTSMHLSMELFKQMTGANLLHVPYKAIQQAITDAMGGQIQIVCDNMGSVLSHVRAGRLRALGVTSPKRSTLVPELPTIGEQGVHGYEITPWSGYMVPTRVPREIVLRLNTEINKAILSPVLIERYLMFSGSTPVGGTPEQFVEHVRRETVKWGQVLKAAGIRAE